MEAIAITDLETGITEMVPVYVVPEDAKTDFAKFSAWIDSLTEVK